MCVAQHECKYCGDNGGVTLHIWRRFRYFQGAEEGGREGRRASCFGEIRDRFVLGILQEGNGHKEHAATEAIKSGLPCMSVKFKCSKTFAKV